MAKGYGRPPMSRKGGKGMGMGMPGLNMDMIKQAQKMQADMEKTLTDNGMTIVEVDKDIFREAVKPAYEKLGWTELREQLYKEAGVEA